MTGDEGHPVRTDPTHHRRGRRVPVRRLDEHRLRVLQERVEPRPAEHADLRDAHEPSFDGKGCFFFSFAPLDEEDDASGEEDEDGSDDEDESDDESDDELDADAPDEDDGSEDEPSVFDEEPALARLSVE
jgi:hypothetical protein